LPPHRRSCSGHDPVRQHRGKPRELGGQEKHGKHGRPQQQHGSGAFFNRGLAYRASQKKPGPDENGAKAADFKPP